jgi:hypothetical protein
MTLTWDAYLSQPATTPVPHLGTRFDATGRFLPERGNTVVAHVLPGSPTDRALRGLRDRLVAAPWAGHFAFTEPESYHMTVFEGVVETRPDPAAWPEGIGPQAGVDAATRAMTDRLAAFSPPPAFRMRVAGVTPFGLALTGASTPDEANARAWRDALSRALRLRTPTHDAYRFHTTLAYARSWVAPSDLPPITAAMDAVTREVQARLPVLDLGPPSFCTFADMNAFPPVLPLAGPDWPGATPPR